MTIKKAYEFRVAPSVRIIFLEVKSESNSSVGSVFYEVIVRRVSDSKYDVLDFRKVTNPFEYLMKMKNQYGMVSSKVILNADKLLNMLKLDKQMENIIYEKDDLESQKNIYKLGKNYIINENEFTIDSSKLRKK